MKKLQFSINIGRNLEALQDTRIAKRCLGTSFSPHLHHFHLITIPSHNSSVTTNTQQVLTLTDELMKDGVCGVRRWNVEVSVNDSQLCRVFKWMLIEAQQEQNTTKCLNTGAQHIS